MTIALMQPAFLAFAWPPDFGTLVNFLAGVVFGFTLCSLTFAVIFLGREKKRERKQIEAGALLLKPEIDEMIRKKQEMLPEIANVARHSYFRVAFDLSFELMNEIAAHYFPDKRYPMYELTPQEILDLNRYITNRLEKIINGKIIRKFKKYRISTIVEIVNRKRDLDNSKLMKINKQFQISKILGNVSLILNAANPVSWLKRSAVKPLMTYVTKEACRRIIAIVGEETDKVYSGKLFAPADDLQKAESDIDAAGAELDDEPDKQAGPNKER
jgi:hypothetical protein